MKRFGKLLTLWVGMMAITVAILSFKGVDFFESLGWALIAATTKTGWSHLLHHWWKDIPVEA